MPNHPNRGWRQRAENSADQWLETNEGKVLAEVPMDPQRAVDGTRKRLRMAYLAGYRDGQKRS